MGLHKRLRISSKNGVSGRAAVVRPCGALKLARLWDGCSPGGGGNLPLDSRSEIKGDMFAGNFDEPKAELFFLSLKQSWS